MIFYSLIAVSVSTWLGYSIYKAIGAFVANRLFTLYFSISPNRFDAIYNVTEESYDYLKEIFKITAKHYEYIEAMRVFEEDARENINNYVREDIDFYKKYFVQILPYIGLPFIFFIPVWFWYIIGLLIGFIAPTTYLTIKQFRNGDYATLASITLAEQAYLYKYKKSIHRKYKSKLSSAKTNTVKAKTK